MIDFFYYNIDKLILLLAGLICLEFQLIGCYRSVCKGESLWKIIAK